ncbi:MAG: hypothetical protein JETCAE02_06970 [Anaerolineaceae bacterium]|jgi:hypothetical protein|nr:hypothetical protein [Anaerolineae bacterium]MBL1171425.1 hypothetical protein [Chloroflexota bacterium]MBV6465304.1 hypothetical protein [Anaerolineales bacterium]MDL1926094.1 hypothetical protein [Anaerolineae bacterium AMX1]OQY85165.1 MAG: hypothetical protein B6D40_04100 [Anaerolineae bacterium UTCFX3]GER80245.1 conserved hypothetical protein [Candidatus Denitrolinea symbiosum]GJQ38285.1 MAG: hypothetical protein JETCAE02_06970 [Anaerolineaceae bacterium]
MSILNKIASVLAFVIGAMAIFAGGRVLLGNDPGYYVINWLPLYNYTMGILTLFITATLIWMNGRFAMPAAIGTFGLHAIVMLILQTAYSGVVASDSIQAMTLRLVVWVIILGLMVAQARGQSQKTGRKT